MTVHHRRAKSSAGAAAVTMTRRAECDVIESHAGRDREHHLANGAWVPEVDGRSRPFGHVTRSATRSMNRIASATRGLTSQLVGSREGRLHQSPYDRGASWHCI